MFLFGLALWNSVPQLKNVCGGSGDGEFRHSVPSIARQLARRTIRCLRALHHGNEAGICSAAEGSSETEWETVWAICSFSSGAFRSTSELWRVVLFCFPSVLVLYCSQRTGEIDCYLAYQTDAIVWSNPAVYLILMCRVSTCGVSVL